MNTKTKFKFNRRFISVLLGIAMVFASLPFLPVVAGSIEETPEASSEDVLISAEYEPGRGEYEKHFLLNDGSFIAVSYADAVHYEDVDGKWVEADNRFVFDENTSRIVSESGDFGTSFAPYAGEGDLVSVSWKDKTLSWSLSVSDGETEYTSAPYVSPEYSEKGKDKDFSGLDINDPETFELDKAYGFISYPSLFEELPEISANYTIAQNKVEEDVYINFPTSAKSFSMNLTAEGVYAVLNEDNSVSLTDESGEQFRIGSPYMEDAKGETLYNITVSVYNENGQIKVTYTPDEEWLSDESRAYPILLDPSVTTKEYASNIVDTYVTQNSTTDNSAKKTLYYGIYNSKINRVYIRVNNLPNIDPTMPVTGATLKMTFLSGTTTGKTANIYKPLSSWTPSTITYANQPGYNNANPLDTVSYSSSQSYMNFDVSSDVISLYLPGGTSNNYGYMIRYADETNVNPDYNVFCSIENNSASKRPVMTVTYGYSLPSSLSPGSVYAFRNAGSYSFMTVHNGSDANDVNVYQKSVSKNNLTNAQKFKLDNVSSTGGYYLRAMCSSNGTNRVLDVYKLNGFVSDTSNVQIYNPTDSLAQHWFIIGLGLYQFKIVPRTDMTLALTAYGDSDGTSSGTTATSAGNIFLSTYTGSSYQKWYIYDSTLNPCESDYTSINNGVYYVNNKSYGKYLHKNGATTSVDAQSGIINETLGNLVKWNVQHNGNNKFTIQSVSDPTKYLRSNPTAGAYLEALPTGSVPNDFLWEFEYLSQTEYRIKSVVNGQYLCETDNGTVYTSTSLSDPNKLVWRCILVSAYHELTGFTVEDMTITVGDSEQPVTSISPSNASLSGQTEFTYEVITSNTYGAVSQIDPLGTVTGGNYGNETVRVTHKPTGISATFNAAVRYSFGMTIQNSDSYQEGCEMNGHNVTINGWADNIKSGLLSANLINRFDYRGTNSWANDLKNHYLIGTNSRANIDDVNFMIYGGHGFAKNRNQGDGLFANNSLHFGTTNSTAGHPSGNGTGAASNFTTADALYFGYDSSNSKWLLTYSCNFLNTYQGDTNVDHLLDNGGRLILGMASKMFVNPGEATTFANYLVATVNNDPVTISQAFMQAGHDVQDGGWLHINYVPAMMYRILYYGPDDEGTLMDSVVQPLSTIVNTGTKNKDEVINENPIHWIEYN